MSTVVRTSPSTEMSRAVAAGNLESSTFMETTASPAVDMTSVVDATTGGGAETMMASSSGSMRTSYFTRQFSDSRQKDQQGTK